MQLILDWDYTLFNTAAFKQAMIAALQPLGITAEQFFTAEQQVKVEHGMYLHEPHLKLLLPQEQHAQARLALQAVFQSTAEFVYPDAAAFLNQIPSEINLTLLTFGNPAWQHTKIEHTGFFQLFRDILLTDRPKTEAIQGHISSGKVVLITDGGEEIDAIKRAYPQITAIRVRRVGTPYAVEPCAAADHVVPDLSTLIHYLF